jgi:hypothetical protein
MRHHHRATTSATTGSASTSSASTGAIGRVAMLDPLHDHTSAQPEHLSP